jgi:uncharacterized protein
MASRNHPGVNMSAERNKQLVLQFIEHMRRGDGAAIAAAYTADGTVWTSGNTLISGKRPASDIEKFANSVLQTFPNGVEYHVTGITAEGDRVAVECESDAVHVSGLPYHNYYHFLFEMSDGKVKSLREYMDTELVTDVLCGGQRPPGSPERKG